MHENFLLACTTDALAHRRRETARENQLAGMQDSFSVTLQVAANVDRHPDAVAVMTASGALTYAQLSTAADRLATELRENGLHSDSIVGVNTGRTLALAISALAVMKAGGAFCVLDPSDPPTRIERLRELGATLMISNGEHPAEPAVKMADEDADRAAPAAIPLADRAVPQSLAYVVFTSGSTGSPKAIGMHHGALNNLIEWTSNAISGQPLRTLQFAALGFDVFVQEIFSTWCSAGTLCIPSDDERSDLGRIAELIEEWKIERIFLPPVALYRLADLAASEDLCLTSLCEVVAAGERLRITDNVRNLFSRLKRCRLHNHYGPAETHVATAYTLPGNAADWPTEAAIGVPISGMRARLLGSDGKPVPPGVPGEIYLEGPGVARCYLNAPDLTADRFIPASGGARSYKTGDLGVLTPEGLLYFAGRTDDQLKIDGYRIEPGEIETVLSQHPAVRECAVTSWQPSPGDLRLVAYVVPDAPIDFMRIRAYLSDLLPAFMIPRHVVVMSALPTSVNGKVDRRNLLPPSHESNWATATIGAGDNLPVNPLEQDIADIWSIVLKVPEVDRNTHFLELGGSSLAAGLVISRLQRLHGIKITLKEFFANPTVAGLAMLSHNRKC